MSLRIYAAAFLSVFLTLLLANRQILKGYAQIQPATSAWQGREIRTSSINPGSNVTSIAIQDTETLFAGSEDGTIKLFNLNSGRLLRTYNGHSSQINALAFNPTRLSLASGSGTSFPASNTVSDNSIKIWNLFSGNLFLSRVLTGQTAPTSELAFSPDGSVLAAGSSDKTIKLWDLQSGRLMRTLTGHTESISAITFSPDGSTLVSGSIDKTIKLWNWRSGRLIRTLNGHTATVTSIAFSPDGSTLASASGRWQFFSSGNSSTATVDNTIKLWNWRSGTLIRTLGSHRNAINSIAFSPDNVTLASGSEDNFLSNSEDSIKLWNWRSGTLIRTLSDVGPIGAVAFSSNGLTLVSNINDAVINFLFGNSGTSINVWRLPDTGSASFAELTPRPSPSSPSPSPSPDTSDPFERGIALANENRFQQAFEAFDEAVRRTPRDHRAWYGRGFALGKLRRFRDAIDSFNRAIQINPGFQEAIDARRDAQECLNSGGRTC